MSSKRRGPGRPAVYVGNLKSHILRLTKEHGLKGAQDILNAKKTDELAELRSQSLVPKPLGISYPTLHRLAHEAKQTFKRGRPSKAA